VKKRRYIGLDNTEDEDIGHDAKKRPDEGYDYDPSADYIYDARQYFDANKYREIVKNRNKEAAKLEKRQKLWASRHHYKSYKKYEPLKHDRYKSKDDGTARVFQLSECVGRRIEDDCVVTVHHKQDMSTSQEFYEKNASLNCTNAASIRHRAKHKHKKRKSKKSSKHSNLVSLPIGTVNKAHRKHSKRKTEKDYENRHKKKKRHKTKRVKSQNKVDVK